MASLTSFVNRRRLDRLFPWIGALVLVAGVATFLVVHIERSNRALARANGNEQAPVQKRTAVPVPAAARHAAIAFLRTAVSRKHLAQSYKLATPTLRQGLSEKQWLTGDIPVPAYPTSAGSIRHIRYSTDYSYARDIQLELFVGPPQGVKMRSVTFLVGLVKRRGVEGRLLGDELRRPRPERPRLVVGGFRGFRRSLVR